MSSKLSANANASARPSPLPASLHLVSGGLSGAASVLILQPLDLVKTRLQESPGSRGLWQTARQVVAEDGPRGLWRGTGPTLYRNVPGVALYFLTLSRLRSGLGRIPFFVDSSASPSSTSTSSSSSLSRKVKLNAIGDLIVGSTARTGVGFILMPVTLLKTLSESSHKYPSSLSTLRDMYKSEGLKALWRGAVPTALRDAPGAGLFIVFYERGRRLMGIRGEGAVGGGIAGSSASLLSTLMTTPFDVLKTQRQLANSSAYTSNNRQGSTLWSVATNIYQTGGLRGFWGGGLLRIVRKAGSAGIGWAVYEGVVSFADKKRAARI